jgi:hypothetical protein
MRRPTVSTTIRPWSQERGLSGGSIAMPWNKLAKISPPPDTAPDWRTGRFFLLSAMAA